VAHGSRGRVALSQGLVVAEEDVLAHRLRHRRRQGADEDGPAQEALTGADHAGLAVHHARAVELEAEAAPLLDQRRQLGEQRVDALGQRHPLAVQAIAARRNAEVVQVVDTACSRNRLLSFDGAAEAEQGRAANRLRDVRHLAEVEAATGRRVCW
jgi:hypothetical protein